ncbi:MAG: hypothetical protein ACLU5I_00090 [Alistipes finegoldii]
MKRIVRIFLCMFLLVLAGACARHKIIPDRKLAQIFHDAFLANAYIGSEQVDIDSLNIYEPIFAGYGYTTEDVYYTIGNFSKRKSARLGDVVELAIEMLEAEGKYYNREVAILDTIDNVACRSFTRTVYADSLIRVGSLRDTARLRFSVDVRPGEYNLSLKYLVDSLDRNEKGLRGVVWLERRDSTHQRLYDDPAPRPAGISPAACRSIPLTGGLGRFHRVPREAPASFADGQRPEDRLYARNLRCRGQSLHAAARHPYFRR